MLKNTLLGLLSFAFLALPSLAQADAPDCFESFSQTKDTNCLDGLLKSLPNRKPPPLPEKTADHSNIEAAVGFFAEIFIQNLREKERLLSLDLPPYTQGVLVEALYRANLPKEAAAYAKAHDLLDIYKQYEAMNLPKMATVKPFAVPSDNDLLIGAYMATGDTTFISRILDNYKNAEDSRVKDAFRVGLMSSKFSNMQAPGRDRTMTMALCERYHCKSDMPDYLRTMTLSTAFWATSSLAKKHEPIKNTLAAFFADDSRLNRLLVLEQNYFATYLQIFVLATTVKKNDPKFEAFLSSYERLDDVNVSDLLNNKN